ncbi:DUF4340 domain-containing protein [bacterium]|nr:DUF4340 domain-containing protein [bacterium]
MILLLTIFVLAPKQEESKEKEANASLLWGGLKRDDILSLSFSNPNGSFNLKKDSQGKDLWILNTADESFEADRDAVTGLVSTMIAAKTEENLKAPSLDQIGLDSPKYRVKVETKESKESQRELLIGNDTPVNYFVYAKWSDSEDIFLTTRSLRFGIDKDAKDLRNKMPLKWHLEDLKEIEYRSLGRGGLDKESFTIKVSDGGWRVNDKSNALISDAELEKWYTPIENSKAQGFVADSKAEKAKLGFKQPLLTLSLTNTNGEKQSWTLASKEVVQGKNKTSEYYWSAEDLDTTYLMKTSFRDSLKLSLFQIREKAVTILDTVKVDRIRISGRTKTMDFKKLADHWSAESDFKGFELGRGNEDTLQRILNAFSNLDSTKYHDGASGWATGLAAPSRTLEFFQGDKLLEKIQVGKKLSDSEIIVQSQFNPSPSSVLMDIEAIVPLKPEPYILKEAKPETTSPEASKEKKKMEATVSSPSELKKLPSAIVKPNHLYTAEINVAGKGLIEITFNSEKAPYTVSNFLHLARNKFYNGLKFHRVIPDFVAQGGDPVGNGTGGPGWIFDFESNDLKHQTGSISMAHASDPNTNGSQFFLVFAPQPHLDGVHTVFGQITKGLDLLNTIKQGDVMEKVEVFEKAL